MTDLSGQLWIIAGIILTALLGWIGTVVAKRVQEPTRIETLWERLDKQDAKITELTRKVDSSTRRADAASRIIRDLARQWPVGTSPRLNPDDLDLLDENTLELDHPWRTKPS